MADLNSLVANYLTKNPNANINDVVDKLGNLDFKLYDNFYETRHESLFDFENGADSMNEDTFINLMATATGKNVNDIKEEAALLFNILDSNDDESKNSLTKDELSIFKSSEGIIDHFSVWNKILVDEEKINKKMASINSENDSEDQQVNNMNTINNKNTKTNNNLKDLKAEMDLNGDGQITQFEIDEYNKKVSGSDNNTEENNDGKTFKDLDTNGDGSIDKSEFTKSDDLFDVLDKNHDGKIANEELDLYNNL